MPYGHPVVWPLYYHYGILLEKENKKTHLKFLKESVNLVEIKFDQGHVIRTKVSMEYTIALLKSRNFKDSKERFLRLRIELNDDIRMSREEELYDEKYKIRSSLRK